MALTISWLLRQSSDTAQYHCLAGEDGLENRITSINVMDNPDTVPWLKEGELVLSTGYIFTKTNLQVDIIKKLKEQGCSGMGIKMHRYMEDIPPQMLKQANELNFPIISIPFTGTMEEIINMIYHKMFQDELSESERLTEMYRDILECSLKNPKLSPMLKKISRYTQTSIFLLQDDFQIIDYHLHGEEKEKYPFPFMRNSNYLFNESDRYLLMENETEITKPVFEHHVEYAKKSYLFVVFPLSDERKKIGYLVCYNRGKRVENINYEFLKRIRSILIVSLLKNQMFLKENALYQDNFYQKILSNSITNMEHLEMLCRQNGFNYSSSYCCMVIHFKKLREYTTFRQKTFLNWIQELIFQICSEYGIDMRFTIYNNDFVAFLYPTEKDMDYVRKQIYAISNKLMTEIKKNEEKCVLGYSCIHHGADKIYTSYSESMQAFELGQTLHPEECVYSFETDIIYHMLERHSTTAQLFGYYEYALKAVEDYDRKNDTDLMKTLEEYIFCGLNLSQAAKKLYIHRNTMNHRMEQIKELLSMDLRNPNHIYLIQTAFYARKLLQD